jgi:hypothetical protein
LQATFLTQRVPQFVLSEAGLPDFLELDTKTGKTNVHKVYHLVKQSQMSVKYSKWQKYQPFPI